MNKIITLVTLLSFLLLSPTIIAQNKDKQSKEHQTVLIPPTNPGNRPKAPAKISLICQYSIGYISLSFPEDANYMEISLSDEAGPVWIGTISRTNPETEIPVLSGEYTITCQTDQNQIFEGTINFN